MVAFGIKRSFGFWACLQYVMKWKTAVSNSLCIILFSLQRCQIDIRFLKADCWTSLDCGSIEWCAVINLLDHCADIQTAKRPPFRRANSWKRDIRIQEGLEWRLQVTAAPRFRARDLI
jgi:hypothetical protein